LQTIDSRRASDSYILRGRQLIEESAISIINKLETLSAGMAETFARSFAKGAESLLAKQEKKLVSHMALPPELPAPLVEPVDLHFKKGKR
jgi:hypothetical protein